MTRDDALFIARRIMDRIEQDQAQHRDAIADEIIAGVAIIEGKRKEEKTPAYVGVDWGKSPSWTSVFISSRQQGKNYVSKAYDAYIKALEQKQYEAIFGKPKT